MAKKMRCLDAWIEVAPALLIPHNKTSNYPRLETITEEELEAEEYDNERIVIFSSCNLGEVSH
ncbi:hypothetical protein L484_024394 [Morus notabilis]|uniref:Uncharacterized protein n=1 Tax=Morus notabilis TaxID=981085 RepID=W9SLJ3_9ROSA|nr:hypothetical protein L484_024394 [Morus notabilis]